jgi:hypothetical protein
MQQHYFRFIFLLIFSILLIGVSSCSTGTKYAKQKPHKFSKAKKIIIPVAKFPMATMP